MHDEDPRRCLAAARQSVESSPGEGTAYLDTRKGVGLRLRGAVPTEKETRPPWNRFAPRSEGCPSAGKNMHPSGAPYPSAIAASLTGRRRRVVWGRSHE